MASVNEPEMTTPQQVVDAIGRVSTSITAHEAYLNELDAVVGDGEHGVNLSRAFSRVVQRLGAGYPEALDELLRLIGMELIAAGGGAGTTFYGIAFVSASKLAKGRASIDGDLLGTMLSTGLAEIRRRGAANPGDKTMIDALVPGVAAVEAAVAGGAGPCAALTAGARAAREGAAATKDMIGRRGRSVYAGERALGTPDPGATSAYLMLCALAGASESIPL